MSRLDLNLVRVFVAIYDAGSVTQAADRLALTQSTLSYSLSKLRDAYSDRLFLRGNNGLIPTALGMVFKTGAEKAVERMNLAT